MNEQILSQKLTDRLNDARIKIHISQTKFEYVLNRINEMRKLSDTRIRLINIDGDTQFIQASRQKPSGSKQDPLYKAVHGEQLRTADREEWYRLDGIKHDLENRSMTKQRYEQLCNEYTTQS